MKVHPNDNRKTAGGFVGPGEVGGTLAETTLTFTGASPTKRTNSTMFTIDEAQPGNNFRVVAVQHPTGGEDYTERVKFHEDAVTLLYTWNGVDQQLPATKRSPLLTVWRTLWVELDSMRAPVFEDGPFEQPNLPDGSPDPQYDAAPGDLGDVSIDLLAQNFLPAKIEVIPIQVDTFPLPVDTTDNEFFYHYIAAVPAVVGPPEIPGPLAAANQIRDLAPREDLWVIHLIHGYENSVGNDFDEDFEDNLGLSVSGSNSAYVFWETIRDRAAFVPDPGNPAHPAQSVDEARLHKRTVLHESGHLMGAVHGSTEWDGIMDPENSKVWQDDSKAVFTVKHFAIFQSKPFPRWDG